MRLIPPWGSPKNTPQAKAVYTIQKQMFRTKRRTVMKKRLSSVTIAAAKSQYERK